MKRHLMAVAAGVAALAACSEGLGPNSTNGIDPDLPSPQAVSLSFTTGGPVGAAASRSGFFASRAAVADTVAEGADTLVITRAQLVLREIELKRVEETAGCDSTASHDDDCEEFEVGPVLVDLPLNGEVSREFAVDIPDGTYDELEFKIHKVSRDDEEDAAFRATHPDFVGISIMVEGTFNGQPFVFTSDLSADQEFALNPPLVVDSTAGPTNVTIMVDLNTWFRVGSVVVNPETGNDGGANEGAITENIKRSIDAFGDEDEDGHHDGHEGGDDDGAGDDSSR